MNSLPHASQQQIDAMNKTAQEKYGVVDEPTVEEQPEPEVQQEEVQIEQSTDESAQTEEVQPQRSSSKEDNMRILRERSEKAERERDELMRYVQDLQSKTQNNQQSQQAEQIKEDLDDLQFNPDDLAEGKHLTKLVNKIKKLEEKLDQSEKKSVTTTNEMRVKRDFPDFDKVASYENLKKLRDQDPDLADAILSTPDTYKQHALAYKMVKQLGIYIEDKYDKEREIALKNSSKPRSLTSISPQQGDSPLSKANAFANGLTDDLKKQLHKEMLEAMKNI